jgi:hypothetical protein
MALPWLIGAAVVSLGSLIVAAVNSDDDSSGSSSGSSSGADEERRRREAAVKEQRRREREEKLANARTLFEAKGAQIGDQLSDALDDLVHVIPATIPSLMARLGEPDLAILPSDDGRAHEVSHTLREAFIEEDPDVERIVDNLEFYARVYDVQMFTNSKSHQRLMALDEVNTQLMNLDGIEQQLRALKRRVTA